MRGNFTFYIEEKFPRCTKIVQNNFCLQTHETERRELKYHKSVCSVDISVYLIFF